MVYQYHKKALIDSECNETSNEEHLHYSEYASGKITGQFYTLPNLVEGG